MSEFLVMAATLIDIKCKMLLPKEVNEDGEEEDPRAELVQKLLEYKMYKYMSFELRDRQVDAARNMYREQRLPKEVEAYRQPIDYEELIGDMNLNKLHEIFKSIVKKQETRSTCPQPVWQYRKGRGGYGHQDAVCGSLCQRT